jgi:DNA/RNA endonuclease YhcR with UshA esterase domain
MEARKKEEIKLKGGDINMKLTGEGELEERKNLKKENLRNMEISLGVGQWKTTHVESKKKNLTLNLKKPKP